MDLSSLSYAHLGNLDYLEELYDRFTIDPQSVDPCWRHFFEGISFGESLKKEEESKEKRILHLQHAYRTFGHLQAQFDPLAFGMKKAAELHLETLGFSSGELNEHFPTLGILAEKEAPLKKILEALEETYCGRVGVEYMGFHSPELEEWVQKQIEPFHFKPRFSLQQKKTILEQLNQSELFEIFLHTRYVGQKRFSLEGGETLIPILHEITELGAEKGIEEFVIGMAHRGRLNVLAAILKKSFSMIFGEFEDFYDPQLTEGTGDVKYHKGFSSNIETSKGKKIHIALSANPSHLESVDPVVEGKVRAKQDFRGDYDRNQILPILIHGDAALAGQGVVYECMQLYRLPGYSTGGTVHLVINNQIGFTTLPKDGRSTRYCTDIAKTFGAPVFHVNAEDPEGCVYATALALEIRRRFHCDVFVEMNCYRKYGHNEGDEPAFTQPIEYQKIRDKKSIRELYRDQLIAEGVVEKEIALELEEKFKKQLHEHLQETKLKKETIVEEAFTGVWASYRKGSEEELLEPVKTGVEKEKLIFLTEQSCKIPEGFTLHPKIVKLLQDRLKMVETPPEKSSIDWALAEQLAFASILTEKTPIRLAGQDSRRGTFSQRHAMWVDQKNDQRYYPLEHLEKNQGRFEVYDSLLSEFAALGFEFGYSLSFPGALVLWEAQFGDFANSAQVIIDQYLSTSEQKWLRFSGLVLLLPHGYEGQGPEHSSGRLERFLQLSAEANIQVVNPTTPAQYFHVLRRQVIRNIRKPLIIFTPKGLLRHPRCLSSLDALSQGHFEDILDDKEMGNAKEILLCSGRIYYDLLAEREKRKGEKMAIIRIEQLYPLNKKLLLDAVKRKEKAKSLIWVQDEPKNMGAWTFLQPQLRELFSDYCLSYVGREESASVATGSHAAHAKEHATLMDQVFKNKA